MAGFVHLTSEKNLRRLLRAGITASEIRRPLSATNKTIKGIYAFPVVPNHLVTHQWLREPRRRGQRSICAVSFRIPDDETVWVGRFNLEHRPATAAEAVAQVLADDPLGFEVIIPRSIRRAEISKARHLPQIVGWRYYPEAKGHAPRCGCNYCVGGQIKARRLRTLWEAGSGPFAR